MRTIAIVNPSSAAGKAGRDWGALSARLGGMEARFTERPNHATEIAAALLRDGYERIIAVGGDGTVNEVINGFFESGAGLRPAAASPTAQLALIPLGTGGDFRRTLGLTNIDEALKLIQSGRPAEPADVGHIRYRTPAGHDATRYFANLVSFGMGGEVAAKAKNFFQILGGKAAFLYSTVDVFLRYRAKTASLLVDGDDGGTHTILNIAIGNGRYHGGGMHVCPRARIDDGQFDVTVIGKLSMLELMRDLPVLYSDNIYSHPKTQHLRGRRIEARSEERVSIEVDGEALGTLPIEVHVIPEAIRILRQP